MGTEFADDYINENEDVIMTVSLFQTAESYYTMKEILVIYHRMSYIKLKEIITPKTMSLFTTEKRKEFQIVIYYI